MKPQISEFSYGFALTNELVGWIPLSVAPIFPSHIEEGKAGGGYDVKLDSPAVSLFIQFKRSHWMIKRSAKEYKAIKDVGGRLNIPYYRFAIMESLLSDQHEMLLDLDNGANLVYYAAPRFHKDVEINHAWEANEVAQRSIFVAPRTIGLIDDKLHSIAFDNSQAWFCSEPNKVDSLEGQELHDKLRQALEIEQRTLGTRLGSLLSELQNAELKGREKAAERRRLGAEMRQKEQKQAMMEELPYAFSAIHSIDPRGKKTSDQDTIRPLEQEPIEFREAKQLDDHAAILRKAADFSARTFDAQMIIVQEAD